MSDWKEEYEREYREMRSGGVEVRGDLLRRLVVACQENPWLRTGGIDFEDDFCLESDYPYHLLRYEDVGLLEKFFRHGNWSIRSAVQHRDLIFVNQVNGGDEWWTLKVAGEKLLPFESITSRSCIDRGEFPALIERLCAASVEKCKSLDY